MKSIVQEVHGCSGSFRLRTVSLHPTLGEARTEAKRRNQVIADSRGIRLPEYLADRSNYEGQFVANRA